MGYNLLTDGFQAGAKLAELTWAQGFERGEAGKGPWSKAKMEEAMRWNVNGGEYLPAHVELFRRIHVAANEAGWLSRGLRGFGRAVGEKEEAALRQIRMCGGLIVTDAGQSFLPAGRESYCRGPVASRVFKLSLLKLIEPTELKSEERATMSPGLGSLNGWYRLTDAAKRMLGEVR